MTFPQPRMVRFAPTALAPLSKRELGGGVRQVLISDGFDAYRDYVLAMQQRTHGMALFDHPDKARVQRDSVWVALAEVDGEPVGVMLYDLKGDRPTEYSMRVSRFYYHTSQGKYLLLQWIARHIDQANRVEMTVPPFELPETWLADMAVTPEPVFRAPMGRVLDVAKIGGMESGPGRFAARVSDPLCPWNEGVWAFETVDGRLEVSAGKEPECELSIQALAALIYGTHDPADFYYRGWGNAAPGVQESIRRMFPPRLPYLHEYF